MNFGGDAIERVIGLAAAQGVQVVGLQFTDLLGGIKQVAVPVAALRGALTAGVCIDGSAVDGFVRLTENNALLWPDPSTFMVLPASDGRSPMARLLCDLRHPDGSAWAGCARQLLRKVLADFTGAGYQVRLALEIEFFLFQGANGTGGNGGGNDRPMPYEQTGYLELSLADGPPQVLVQHLATAVGGLASLHHEIAPGQYGVTLTASDPLTAADRLITCRQLVKEVAHRLGAHATFMPKPLYGVSGSGLHMYEWLLRDGRNACHDPDGAYGLSTTARYLVGGQLAHARGYSSVTNPLVNSYKRLVPGYEAPVYVAWSERNRSPFIRIPKAGTGPTRVELRGPDAACNPYLALAVILAAGLDGINNRIEPPPPINRDVYELTPRERAELGIDSLPGSLGEAVEALLQDELVLATLGDYVAERFLEAKQIEWDLYRTQVHRWEIEQYLTSF